MNRFEWFSLLLSAGLLGGYYLWLAIEVRRRPLRTIIGYSAIKRREWVCSVMTDRGDILAVQTLRNWSTAASFLATTAILIASGALHFLTTIPEQGSGDLATVQKLLDRGGLHYTLGMRCFYLAVPFALWLFGALWLLLGSVVLCIALYLMDHLD